MKSFQPKFTHEDLNQPLATTPLVSAYMVNLSKLITFQVDTPIYEVLDTLLENRITGAPVLDKEGNLVGLIDDKDCLHLLIGGGYYDLPIGKETVDAYMSNIMKTIPASLDILRAANIFLTTPYKRLVVVDDKGKLMGQISRRDILRAIQDLHSSS